MARKQNVVSSPLKLPKAPPGYSERDQDHTRRLIELALIAYTQQIAGVIEDITVAGEFGKDFPPVSPIHAGVGTFGDAGGFPPVIQLQNPVGSGKIMVVYEFYGSQDGSANQQIRLNITDNPAVDNAGVITTAVTARRDENDATAIVGTLKAFTKMLPNPPFLTENANFWETVANTGATPPGAQIPIVKPGTHPLVLLPGHTLQFTNPTASAASRVSAYAVWDELPLGDIIGTNIPTDPTRPIDSIWGAVRTNGSVNGAPFISLINPGPKYMRVTGLYVLADGVPNFVGVRRTNQRILPGVGATTLNGKVRRMNGGSIGQVTGQLLATNFTTNGDNFHTSVSPGSSFWRDKGRSVAAGLQYTPVIGPFGSPMIVKPNSAIEVSSAVNGVGLVIGALFMWDEVDSI